MTITLHRLEVDDWERFRAVRLEALRSDPGVFSARLADALARSDEGWQDFLRNPNTAVFGVFDGEQMIGITGISIDREDPTGETAMLWGSWLRPDYRGRGISKAMYEARLGWAKAHPICKKVVVSHRESNIASRNANQKNGFRFVGKSDPQTWPDGGVEPILDYELQL